MNAGRTALVALLIALTLGALALAATMGGVTAAAAPALGSTIRYVAPMGNDGANACASAPSPCRSFQHAIDMAEPGDELRVAAGTYSGVRTAIIDAWNGPLTFTQVALITKTLTLRGGFSTENWASPDPAANRTVIDAEQRGRGITIYGTGSERVTVEGVTVTGGDYTGLGNPPGAWTVCRRTGADCAGGIFAQGVTILLRDSTVTGNDAGRTTPYSDGGGVYLWGVMAGSRIERCTISNNQATAGDAYGGGMMVIDGYGVAIEGTIFEGNTALRGGGGLRISDPDWIPMVIRDTVFRDNKLSGEQGSGEGAGLQASLAMEGDALLMDRVIMEGNRANRGVSGIFIEKIGGGVSSARLSNLILAGNISDVDDESSVIAVGRGYNLALSMAHVTAADNATTSFLRAFGPYEDRSLTVTLTNTLITSATYAFTALQWAGPMSIEHANTLTHNVTEMHHVEDGAPAFQATNPVSGDPRLDATYHLKAGSAAIDSGIDAGVRTDIDGQVRPWGSDYDIGADEYGAPLATPTPTETAIPSATATAAATGTATPTVTPSCDDDRLEENDSCQTPRPLSPGVYRDLRVCSGDEDWLALDMQAGQNATITIRFQHQEGDLEMQLYRPDCQERLVASSTSTDDEEISFRANAPGAYRIRVFGYQGAANRYDLEVSLIGGTRPVHVPLLLRS